MRSVIAQNERFDGYSGFRLPARGQPGRFKLLQVRLADDILLADLDGGQFFCPNPIPDCDDLDVIQVCDLLTGISRLHGLTTF